VTTSVTSHCACTHAHALTATTLQMGAPGELPPNSSDEEESSSDESDEPAPAPPRRKKDADASVGAEQTAKDMERLRLAKAAREEQRQKRIAAEGWDRFAPVTATNKPPDARPADHPDFQK
jgi:hypothetical protein